MRPDTYTQPRLGSLPLIARSPVKVVCGCKGCTFVASALTESCALRGWAYHRIHVHSEGGK